MHALTGPPKARAPVLADWSPPAAKSNPPSTCQVPTSYQRCDLFDGLGAPPQAPRPCSVPIQSLPGPATHENSEPPSIEGHRRLIFFFLPVAPGELPKLTRIPSLLLFFPLLLSRPIHSRPFSSSHRPRPFAAHHALGLVGFDGIGLFLYSFFRLRRWPFRGSSLVFFPSKPRHFLGHEIAVFDISHTQPHTLRETGPWTCVGEIRYLYQTLGRACLRYQRDPRRRTKA